MFLIPPIKSSAFERCAYTIAVILLFSEIIPSCSCYEEKKLVYIAIIAPSSYQSSFCVKYTKLNMHLSYNIRLVSNAKCL